MSDVAETTAPAASPSPSAIAELRVSGHLMTLDTGLFCVFQPPGAPAAGRSGLPGIRLSPAPAAREGTVRIASFTPDGWLPGGDGAALVRVTEGPAQVLVTIYQAPDAPPAAAPRLQVLRLSADPAAEAAAPPAPGAAPGTAPSAAVASGPVLAHIQRTGDVSAALGEWVGVRGSKLWIEGFAIAPADDVILEYQAVLGQNWLSSWVEAGAFCGSRGMALPLLGLAARVKGDPARECLIAASFGDGTLLEDVPEGTAAQSPALAPLEAFRVSLRPRAAPARPAAPRKTARRPR
ncbi:MAG: hypothetical protein ACP5NP_13550 [Acetobacteraceae bacterium]